MMETRLNIEENKGTVTAYEDGTAVGDLTFKIRSEGIIVITHTLAFEGNEGKGISRLVREKCDMIVSLPMKGSINSLNASVAAGILIYHALKGRS